MLKEALISTSSVSNHGSGLAHSADRPHPPAIAHVALHIRRLRDMLLNRATADSPLVTKYDTTQFQYLPISPIKPTELERITTVCDLLDDLYSWAIEEGSTFVTEPSILSQERVPEVICACLLSERPRVVTKALQIAPHLLRHRTSSAELHRVVEAIYRTSEKQRLGSGSTHHLDPPPMIRLLNRMLQTFSNCADAVAGTLEMAKELSLATGCILYTADSFICADFISNVLMAWQQHETKVSVVTRAVAFFASLIQLPRRLPEETPVAILLTHIGCVLACMVKAMRAHIGNTSVRNAVLVFFAVCARYDQNRERLINAGAYAAAMTTLAIKTAAHSDVEVLGPAVECVSYCVPLLDSFQCRSLLLAIHGLLTHRGEIATTQLALVLLYRLLLTLPPGTFQDRYVLYAQPCSFSFESDRNMSAQHASKPTCLQLKNTNLLDHLPLYEDTKRFMHHICIPQLVAHVIDYYHQEMTMLTLDRHEESNNEPNDENSSSQMMQQVFALAKRCMAVMNGLELAEDYGEQLYNPKHIGREKYPYRSMPLNEAEYNNFTLQFLLLDTNLDGFLASDQVKCLLRSLGFYPSEADIERVLALVDDQKRGLVGKDKLIPIVEKLYAQKSQRDVEAELRVALRVLDEDMDGYITTGQLRHVLLNMGTPLTREVADVILDDVEKDSDDKINVEELIAMLLSSAK